ncbi:MAG TPA: DNA-binding protein WhiA [Candidatus Limnocylindrales bacterium]|nr:DNA-binding protein WhiA [Candidatus Limnocylindrales bacterium]
MARPRPSFADDVKAELAGLQPARPCCQHAELHAIVAAATGRRATGSITVRIPRNAVARKLVQLARATGSQVDHLGKGPTDRRPTYRLRLTLSESGASADVCCARAAIRGAFLARGTVGEPVGGYHLELALAPPSLEELRPYLDRLGLPARAVMRRGRAVWYLKGADAIRRVLGLMGANRAVMRFEHDRIVREMRSQANRRVNSETANIEKRLRSAHDQVKRIRALHQADPQLASLAPALRQAADLRLAHPQAGLRELAAAAHVTKSAMAGRLRRLMQKPTRREAGGERVAARLNSIS